MKNIIEDVCGSRGAHIKLLALIESAQAIIRSFSLILSRFSPKFKLMIFPPSLNMPLIALGIIYIQMHLYPYVPYLYKYEMDFCTDSDTKCCVVTILRAWGVCVGGGVQWKKKDFPKLRMQCQIGLKH